jgi:hypothetical protein
VREHRLSAQQGGSTRRPATAFPALEPLMHYRTGFSGVFAWRPSPGGNFGLSSRRKPLKTRGQSA